MPWPRTRPWTGPSLGVGALGLRVPDPAPQIQPPTWVLRYLVDLKLAYPGHRATSTQAPVPRFSSGAGHIRPVSTLDFAVVLSLKACRHPCEVAAESRARFCMTPGLAAED